LILRGVSGALALLALVGPCALAPGRALAHEKWFSDPQFHPSETALVLSDRTLIALGVGTVAVLLLWALQRLIGDPLWPRLAIFQRMREGDVRLLAVQTAIALIYMAVRLALLTPHLSLPQAPLGFALAGVQLLIAFSFITRILDRGGAALLILMGLVVAVVFSPLDALQLAFYGGIAVLILVSGVGRSAAAPQPPVSEPEWGQRALVAMRVLSGVAFLFIALGDKIWNPDLGLAFLEKYPHFNVARLVGWEVPDETFALVAGVIEVAAGMLLISGFLTRVVIAVLLVPFNLTVPFLPAEEMIGHLPIFGILYVLLVNGPGRWRREASSKGVDGGS
jgi:uncharacterized membrane protein YphA (DoxX/SURF4 family)